VNASMIPPEQFASLVAQASDEQLAEGMRANGELILEEIFARMPQELDPARAAGVEAVVEWRVGEGGDAEARCWQLTIKDGACTCVRDGDADPDVTFEVAPVDFVKLVAGVANGPKLFVFGRLRIRGNLMLAARVPGFFRVPGARDQAGP
jgi:putative sterol carrier protein